MALTAHQRAVLKDWAPLRINNWVYTQEYHEGIKETVQVVDPLSGETLDKQVPVMEQASRMVDIYGPGPVDPEDKTPPVVIGQEEVFFMRRSFIVRSLQMIDREEVITRLHRKALKRGMTDLKDVTTYVTDPNTGEETSFVTETEVPVRRHTIGNFFRNNRAYFRDLIPGVEWEGANRAGRKAALTEDPDA